MSIFPIPQERMKRDIENAAADAQDYLDHSNVPEMIERKRIELADLTQMLEDLDRVSQFHTGWEKYVAYRER